MRWAWVAVCWMASSHCFAICSDSDRSTVRLIRAHDQAIRGDGVLPSLGERRWMNALEALSMRHQQLLRPILSRCSWTFGRDAWGEEAEAAWYVVQHADDLSFQRAQLEDLQRLSATFPGVPRKQLAYLEDRVLLGEGKAQRYGSQLEVVDGQLVPLPIDRPAELNERRASMGLPSMEAYLAEASAKWKAMSHQR